jgi:DNA-binding transcriptional ArsR family regulator
MAQQATDSQRIDPFAALADEQRRSILTLLSDRARPVGELAAALPISRPAVSRHLAVLKSAGLVVEERRGTRHIYRLHHEGVAAVEQYLRTIWGDVARRFTIAAENISHE